MSSVLVIRVFGCKVEGVVVMRVTKLVLLEGGVGLKEVGFRTVADEVRDGEGRSFCLAPDIC